jgi:hypothetical protein
MALYEYHEDSHTFQAIFLITYVFVKMERSERSLSDLLKEQTVKMVRERFLLFLSGDYSVLPHSPAIIFTYDEILKMSNCREAMFCLWFCDYDGKRPSAEEGEQDTRCIDLSNFEIRNEYDMILFGIYYRKCEPPNLEDASDDARRIVINKPQVIIFIIPITFHMIVIIKECPAGEHDVEIDPEEPHAVLFNGQEVHPLMVARNIGKHCIDRTTGKRILPQLTSHLILHYTEYTNKLY